MKTPLQADRYYQIIIAIAGLVLLIYSLFVYPPTDTNPVIFLLLAVLAGFLVQYPISLLQNEFTLIPLVALGGSLIVGSNTCSLGNHLGNFLWLLLPVAGV